MDYKSCKMMVVIETNGNQQTYGEVDISQEVNDTEDIKMLMDEKGAIIRARFIQAFKRAQEEVGKL